MRTRLAYGGRHIDLEIPEQRLIPVRAGPRGPALADPGEAVRHALENPFEFPALRRALTPDDHVTIVVDEGLPHLAQLLVPLLEHLEQAGIQPEAVTLLCLPPSTEQPWLDDLPDAYQDMHVEVHQPGDRKKLSYLAATREGKRIYLNRSAVDADQLIILAQRTFDCLLGYGGGSGVIYPLLSDEPTLHDVASKLSPQPPAARTWPLRQQADEVCWLVGTPFFIQVIAGPLETLLHVVAGPVQSLTEGERLLEASWHVEAERAADLVVASVGGERHARGFGDLAQAFLAASRIVKPAGQIVVLSDLQPVLGREAALMKRTNDPVKAFQLILQDKTCPLQPAYAWTSAAVKAQLHLRTGLAKEPVEDLFVQPIEGDAQIHGLIAAAASVAVLPDAHQTLAIVKNEPRTQ